MAKFPILEWESVNNKQVPFTAPQHYDDNETDVLKTGKKNPLPVANYTLGSNGIYLPTSEDNPMPTKLTGSIVEEVFRSEELTLSPGSNTFVRTTVDISRFSKFNVAVGVSSISHEYEVIARFHARDNTILGDVTILPEELVSRRIGELIPVRSEKVSIRLYNQSSGTQTYPHICCYGFK